MKNTLILILLISPILFTGCATITKDDSQPVAFSSDPQGATVVINDVARGITPTTIMVKRAMKKQLVPIDEPKPMPVSTVIEDEETPVPQEI